METQTKTPVEIVQELIAIHSTRKEAGEKINEKAVAKDIADKLVTATQQSDKFIAELMNELSTFGDAVKEDVDRENEYQAMWKHAMANIDATDPKDLANSFQEMEDTLKKIYQVLLEAADKLPVSLQETLTRQMNKL